MHHSGRSSVGDGGVGFIEHIVSKFDTLAGVAIKYGVEVVFFRYFSIYDVALLIIYID